MKIWIAKWNRKDRTKPELEHVWTTALSRGGKFRCYGRAEGEGGQKLRPLASNDLAVCYQTDTKLIVGVCRIEDVQGDASEPHVVLSRLARFDPPLSLGELIDEHPELANLPAFKPGVVYTFRAIDVEGFRILMRACGAEETSVAAWLRATVAVPT